MLANEEIKSLIAGGESQTVELKESFPGQDKAAKIICAFANTMGGALIIGVDKNGKPCGIPGSVDDLQKKVSNSCQDVKSVPMISQEIHQIDGKKILVVIVHKANDGNFHTLHGAIYVRYGSTNQKLEGQATLDYLRSRQLLCFDELLSDAGLDELSSEKFHRLLTERDQAELLKTHSLEDLFLSMRLATTQSGKVNVKNAALLLFGKDPTKLIPQAEFKLIKFSGVEPVNVVSHKLIQSSLVEQIEGALSFIKQNLSKQLRLVPDSAKREDIYEYPAFVLREAVVNAVAHRDYFSKDVIQVNIFDDRIEFINPGTIPAGLSPSRFGSVSVPRNPIIYRILRDLRYVEGFGTGVPRMRNELRKAGLKDPEFDFSGNHFVLTIRNAKSLMKPVEGFEDLNGRQKKALEYLRQNHSIKSKTYAEINNVSIPTAINDLRELTNFKFVKKVGSYRGAHYILNPEKFK